MRPLRPREIRDLNRVTQPVGKRIRFQSRADSTARGPVRAALSLEVTGPVEVTLLTLAEFAAVSQSVLFMCPDLRGS